MVILPIEKKLKKKHHKDIALAQDLLVIEMYKTLTTPIIHGGTAIWRCYSGNRFSEDIDVYLPKKLKNSTQLKKFRENLEKMGFQTQKFKETENSIYSAFAYNDAIIRFEVVFENIKSYVSKEFELSDGTFIIVYTLTPEEIIKEKIKAYQKRQKIRDLYDIYFLLNYVKEKNEISKLINNLLKNFKPPLDEKDLPTLIISGAIPKLEDLIKAIEIWAK
ncbi:MAG: nucleotidyl transferase AbiEii/AbiGii toxin family protein [Candidatus Aenigmatarchaeota archaeon]